jgi:GH24 family phage-related lysozyme (muramidase)
MHPSVVDRFREFSVRFEGLVHWPYLDVKGLVTVGIGNLIDPVSAALALPWVLEGSGDKATPEQVVADWNALKVQQRLSKLHFNYARPLTKIRLTEEGVDTLVRSKLLANEAYMRQRLPGWDTWPADAQLFACSMAWAVGPGWVGIFKNCVAFLLKGDWDNAAKCAAIRTEGNPGIVPRNAANQVCLHNAKTVSLRQLDPSVLYWPGHPDPVGDPIHNLQAEASRTLAEWRGVPCRFPEEKIS